MHLVIDEYPMNGEDQAQRTQENTLSTQHVDPPPQCDLGGPEDRAHAAMNCR